MISIEYIDLDGAVKVVIRRGYLTSREYFQRKESPSLKRLGLVVKKWLDNNEATTKFDLFHKRLLVEKQ